jgi:hypothetical protein
MFNINEFSVTGAEQGKGMVEVEMRITRRG